MTVTNLDAAKRRLEPAQEAGKEDAAVAAARTEPGTEPKNGKEQAAGEKGKSRNRQTALPPSPEVLRLQYSYELERSREVSSSVNRLTMVIPVMIFVVCLMLGMIAPMCTNNISMHIFLILGVADIIVLLGGLVVACTVHFYILNPAPPQTEEYEWMIKMKRDLQRGNNWRAWLVFAATLLIYVSAAITLAMLILCLIGR